MSDLMTEALNLAIYGMGTVFVFLTLLVFATMLMSRLVGSDTPAQTSPSTPQAATGIDPNTLAAITVAIQRYRKDHPPG